VSELDHHRGSVVMTLVGNLLQPRYDLIIEGVEIAEGGRRVCRYDCRSSRHGERDTTFCALNVVFTVAILRHTVFVVIWFVEESINLFFKSGA